MANGIIKKGGGLPCPVDASGVFTDEVTDFKRQYVKVFIIIVLFFPPFLLQNSISELAREQVPERVLSTTKQVKLLILFVGFCAISWHTVIADDVAAAVANNEQLLVGPVSL